MKVDKKVISNLTKCYSIAPLRCKNRDCLLVAAEKQDPCLLFDLDGKELDKVWDGPGGTMSMVQVPGQDGQFLATQKFYSPNDAKEAKIVIVALQADGSWNVQTLVELSFVHRFDIVQRNCVNYLIACTIKSGHECKDDWSMPGKVYAALLPEDLSIFGEENLLELKEIQSGMLKNHGYYKCRENGTDSCVISADSGVYQFFPPETPEESWSQICLLNAPASDAVLVDLDEDGEKELAVLSPFHGDKVSIYKKSDGQFKKVYEYGKSVEFAHAIYGGRLCGREALVVGHRKGERNLLAFLWNKERQEYYTEVIDCDCGSANVFHYEKDGKDFLVSANREVNEVALYTLEM